ncbi:MAG: aminopeptidase P family protein [Actinobacteria bacterium]|nr:aminopeptidase P family protein [Actinomycetota bacterium]
MDVAGRVPRLVELLPTAGPDEQPVDGLLVTSLTNIRYLTGFTGSAALLVVHADGLLLVTDGRYRDQSAEQLAAAGVDARIEISNQQQKEVVHDGVTGFGIATLGLEAEHVSWAQQQSYATEWFEAAELVPTRGVIEDLREVKDAGEIARIAAAAGLADQALANIRTRLLERPTEEEFGLELDTEMRRLGATAPSFETIVASGPHGALPHARPTDRVIEAGDLVVLDFGALVDGYCSDMSRTIMVGEPSAQQQRMLHVVREAQQAGVDAVKPGLGAAELDKVCRDVIDGYGWADAFLHSTGHGVGLDIHERPRVGPKGDATLAAGYVVTVEPGVYLPDHGGVRIEDTLVVTDDGCRPLTLAPKTTAA